MSEDTSKPKRRGFAAIDPERRRAIASLGGKAAHIKGTAHQWSSAEARVAGAKGGQISRGGRGRLLTVDEARRRLDVAPMPTDRKAARR